jgi:hypothetical protein
MAERITWDLKQTKILSGITAEGTVKAHLIGEIFGDISIWANQPSMDKSIMSIVVGIIAFSPIGYITTKIQSDYNVYPYIDVFSLWGYNGNEFDKMKEDTITECKKGIISYCEKCGLDYSKINWEATKVSIIDPIAD